MHDGGGDRPHTAAALPVIIAQLEAGGYTDACRRSSDVAVEVNDRGESLQKYAPR
jgi:hypothetical protein